MTNKRFSERKRLPKCCYSGKLIYVGRKAILVQYIEEFLKKNGCDIIVWRKNEFVK